MNRIISPKQKVFVALDDVSSDAEIIACGVPQGST